MKIVLSPTVKFFAEEDEPVLFDAAIFLLLPDLTLKVDRVGALALLTR